MCISHFLKEDVVIKQRVHFTESDHNTQRTKKKLGNERILEVI